MKFLIIKLMFYFDYIFDIKINFIFKNLIFRCSYSYLKCLIFSLVCLYTPAYMTCLLQPSSQPSCQPTLHPTTHPL